MFSRFFSCKMVGSGIEGKKFSAYSDNHFLGSKNHELYNFIASKRAELHN